MKCPKCKYTSFDYLDLCPRCGKDITEEKAKLHIMSIKPNPPFLLGSLTGDLDDSSAGFVVPQAVKNTGESMSIDAGEIYDDGSDLNINIDEESLADPELGKEGMGDFIPADDDYEMEIDLDSDQIPDEIEIEGMPSRGSEGPPAAEKKEQRAEGEDFELEVDDLDLKLDTNDDTDSDK
ncbi:MAG: hypothetical protein ACOC6B_06215 [Thermodesulfobacteriota bacterium]